MINILLITEYLVSFQSILLMSLKRYITASCRSVSVLLDPTRNVLGSFGKGNLMTEFFKSRGKWLCNILLIFFQLDLIEYRKCIGSFITRIFIRSVISKLSELSLNSGWACYCSFFRAYQHSFVEVWQSSIINALLGGYHAS